jgi:hypothetical protein
MWKLIGRFIEDALIVFGDWYVPSDWLGKERDCVNMFAHEFLSHVIKPGEAIEQYFLSATPTMTYTFSIAHPQLHEESHVRT